MLVQIATQMPQGMLPNKFPGPRGYVTAGLSLLNFEHIGIRQAELPKLRIAWTTEESSMLKAVNEMLGYCSADHADIRQTFIKLQCSQSVTIEITPCR